MSRTVPSFAEEGLKRFLHGMDRRVRDLERRGDWRFDQEIEVTSTAEESSWVKVASIDAWGIVSNGTQWWATDGSGRHVYTYDANWNSTSNFPATEVSTSGGQVRGIGFDGTDLWVMGDDEEVGRYSTDGVYLQNIDLEATWPAEVYGGGVTGSGRGVTFDGTDLWFAGGYSQQVRRYSTAGVALQTIQLAVVPNGLTWYDGHLWIVDTAGNQLLKYSRAGALVDTLDVSGAVTAPTGVWISDDGDLYISKDGDGVYLWRPDLWDGGGDWFWDNRAAEAAAAAGTETVFAPGYTVTDASNLDVAVTFVWGITAAEVPYYNAAGVTAGDEAVLVLDNATGTYSLRPVEV